MLCCQHIQIRHSETRSITNNKTTLTFVYIFEFLQFRVMESRHKPKKIYEIHDLIIMLKRNSAPYVSIADITTYHQPINLVKNLLCPNNRHSHPRQSCILIIDNVINAPAIALKCNFRHQIWYIHPIGTKGNMTVFMHLIAHQDISPVHGQVFAIDIVTRCMPFIGRLGLGVEQEIMLDAMTTQITLYLLPVLLRSNSDD